MEDTEEQMEEDNWEELSFLQTIPDDLLLHIFSFLDCNSLLEASKTCTKWRCVAADESLWKELLGLKVGKQKSELPECKNWHQEFRRLSINVPTIESEALTEHEDEVYHVLFSPSGKYFSTTGKDGLVVVWELGSPTHVYTKKQVVTNPSYTRFSEFNQSETKLLVAGMEMEPFYDGFIKIFEFGKELTELCMVRIAHPNFRGAWYNDDTFISILRISIPEHGHRIQVRAHEAVKKLCDHEYTELSILQHNCHRNDFVRIVDKSKWPLFKKQAVEQFYSSSNSVKKIKVEDMEEESDVLEPCDESCDKSIILYQTTWSHHSSAVQQYQITNNALYSDDRYFASPQVLHEGALTVLGTNLSTDHRFITYALRQRSEANDGRYKTDIEVRVYDLQNDCDTGEVYFGAQAVREENVSYIFPSISKDFISCGSENLKGYIWDRNYGIMVSELSHERGIHSQNGVNATAFCPTDQEVLVTVADDLIVRVWRSKQRLEEFRTQSMLKIKQTDTEESLPGCSGYHLQGNMSGDYVDQSEIDNGDIVEDDSTVSCCYGIKHKKSAVKKKMKKTSQMAVVNL